MIKAIHIEDEPGIVSLLKNLISKYCSDKIEMVGSAGTVPDAIELIKEQRPQIVYLDIELNQGNAFDLLHQLQETIGIDFAIIFITAFNDYAIKAFRQNAVDYILKPISIDELKEATDKAILKVNSNSDNQHLTELIKLLANSTPAFNVKIRLPVTEGFHYVSINDIIRIEAKGSYAKIFMINNQSLVLSKSLKEVETILPTAVFFRVHHTWIINRNHLKKYFRGKNGYVEMDDGSIVPVSHRRKGGEWAAL